MRTICAIAVVLLAGCAAAPRAGPSASASLEPKSGTGAHGKLRFTQVGSKVLVTGEVAGLSPGPHGFHVHENGDCGGNDAAAAGGHFNPAAQKHGGRANGHAGDMGNIEADMYGKADVEVELNNRSVAEGPNALLGKAVVVHVGPDDLKTDPAGNSGARIACGIINKN